MTGDVSHSRQLDRPQCEEEQSSRRTGGQKRTVNFVIYVCRLAIVPIVWWGMFGFHGLSGIQLLKDGLGLDTLGAAAMMAFLLAALSIAALLPCVLKESKTK